MVTTKNLPKIVVTLDEKNMTTLELISAAQRVKTAGDPAAGSSPVTDTIIHGQVTTLETMYNNSKLIPPTATSSQVSQQRNIVETSYKKIGLYVQGAANDAAIAAGDVAAGEAVVRRCGFKLKKQSIKLPRNFRVIPLGAGSVEISTKAVGDRAGYIRQYGTTTAKGVPPPVVSEPVFSLEADIHIDGLKSGCIYGFREASILPVKRSKKTPSAVSATQRSATPTLTTKAHKATFSDGASHYIWSDWIYVVIP
jgi:hypothetical protein